MLTVIQLLDRWLDPVGLALNADAASKLLSIRADSETQQRVDDLADRNAEGLLTDDERAELEALVAAADLVGVLQAKARRFLAASPTAA